MANNGLIEAGSINLKRPSITPFCPPFIYFFKIVITTDCCNTFATVFGDVPINICTSDDVHMLQQLSVGGNIIGTFWFSWLGFKPTFVTSVTM
jgi:hypothetical protein